MEYISVASNNENNFSLRSPLGTFDIEELNFETYPVMKRIYDKISRCGGIYLKFLNKKTLEIIDIQAFDEF